MVVAIVLALVIAILVIRGAPKPLVPGTQQIVAGAAVADVRPGVQATITAGGVTVQRTLPTLAFALEPGQVLDPRLPAGPFEARLTATFHPGKVRRAALGAFLQGGSLILLRRQEPLISAAAGSDRTLLMTDRPHFLGRRLQQVEYVVRSDGDQPIRVQAMWQPEEAQTALPLPAGGAPLLQEDVGTGELLVQLLNCAACHVSQDESLQALLAVSPGPILGQIGAQVRPQWIRRWLRDPHAVKPGTLMPRILLDDLEHPEWVEDLTHFLVSMGGPMAEGPSEESDAALIETGKSLFHRVGCFACHGPLEPGDDLESDTAGTQVAAGSLTRTYVALPALAPKTSVAALARFLRDPLAVRPNGRMPSLNLSEIEARAIAAYLVARRAPEEDPRAEPPFVLDPERVGRGQALFAEARCAACHDLGPDRSAIAPAPGGRSLEGLTGASLDRGCLAVDPPGGAPDFMLTGRQRASIRSFLVSIPQRRCQDAPLDRLATTVHRLNCLACHAFHGAHGPEAALARYFTTAAEVDLGDEGRMPPRLSHVGAKLNPGWLRAVLEEGGRARPYMATRMPDFGRANVHALPGLLAAAAGADQVPDDGPPFRSDAADAGRQLVGASAFNCIQCHTVAGHDATGTPGPDLAHLVERLRFDTFARWLHDPAQMRRGTRMPTFFFGGRSAFTDILGGEAEAQIEAVWCYLSQGEMLPLPEGLIDPAGFDLVVVDEPIVVRTFMTDAGERAIACGFPEQVHCAFDAQRCQITAVWTGQFLNVQGAWAARGGTTTDPAAVRWKAPAEPLLTIVDGPSAGDLTQTRFRGYELDRTGHPTFEYDLQLAGTPIHVREQPRAARDESGPSLSRHFTLEGPAGAAVRINGAGLRLVASTPDAVHEAPGTIIVPLDGAGRATFTLEVCW